jgi:hypothetical protein
MKIRYYAARLGIAIALAGAVSLPALADEWDKETVFTFNEPVEVPGHVLMPGTYVFRLADTQDRDVVQIFSEDSHQREHLVTTVLAIPDIREETPDKPSIRFEERRAESPEAVRSWFYPGDRTGWEFVYPKSERLLASAARPAPEMPPALPAPPPAPAAEPQSAPASVPMAAASEPPAPQQRVQIAQNITSATPEPSPAPQQLPSRLPQTAGQLPTLELLGALLMSTGAFVLRFAPAPEKR